LQSASRSTLSSSRWSFRALPVAVLLLASAAFGQASPAVATSTILTAAPANTSGKTVLTVHVSPVPSTDTSSSVNSAGSSVSNTDRGSVTFEETDSNGQPRSLGSAFVQADGSATLTVPALTAGAHSVRAVYNGTQTAASSTSEAAEVTSEASAPDFSLSATPTTLNLTAGAQGTVAITVAPGAGFSNYVALSCAGLPLFTTCNFLPSNVDVAGVNGLSTMTLNTTAPSGGGQTLLRQDRGLVYCFLLPGALGLAGLAFGRNRGLRTLAMLCVVGSLIGGAGSCAQRYRYLNYGPSANPGTPAGQSIIRIYGTAVNGALSTSKCFQVTLNMTSTNTSGTAGNNLTPCS
jgi:Bacterial Ig-like domain (group 3)